MMTKLNVKWQVDLPSKEPALLATYKGRKLRMTAEGKLYIGWIDGERRISAKSKGELYRKYAEALANDRLAKAFNDSGVFKPFICKGGK